jgi:hypothetical protein
MMSGPKRASQPCPSRGAALPHTRASERLARPAGRPLVSKGLEIVPGVHESTACAAARLNSLPLGKIVVWRLPGSRSGGPRPAGAG